LWSGGGATRTSALSESGGFSETSLHFFRTTRRIIPKVSNVDGNKISGTI